MRESAYFVCVCASLPKPLSLTLCAGRFRSRCDWTTSHIVSRDRGRADPGRRSDEERGEEGEAGRSAPGARPSKRARNAAASTLNASSASSKLGRAVYWTSKKSDRAADARPAGLASPPQSASRSAAQAAASVGRGVRVRSRKANRRTFFGGLDGATATPAAAAAAAVAAAARAGTPAADAARSLRSTPKMVRRRGLPAPASRPTSFAHRLTTSTSATAMANSAVWRTKEASSSPRSRPSAPSRSSTSVSGGEGGEAGAPPPPLPPSLAAASQMPRVVWDRPARASISSKVVPNCVRWRGWWRKMMGEWEDGEGRGAPVSDERRARANKHARKRPWHAPAR